MRLRYLLHPAAVGGAAVVEQDAGPEPEVGVAGPVLLGRRAERGLPEAARRRPLLHRLPDAAPPQGVLPELLRLRLRRQPRPQALPAHAQPVLEVGYRFLRSLRRQRAARRLRDGEQHVAGRPRVEQPLHRRLHQAVDADGRLVVAPRFERRVDRQHPVGLRGRLVQHGAQVDEQPGPAQVGGGGRHRVRGVGVVDDQDVLAAQPRQHPAHVLMGRGVADGVRAGEVDGRADAARRIVQQPDGQRRVPGRRAGAGVRTGQRHAGLRLDERPRQLLDAGRLHARDGPRQSGGRPAEVPGVVLRPALLHDGLEHGQRHGALGAGRHLQELVRVGGRHGEARADVDEAADAPVAVGVHPPEMPRELHRRDPRLQEVGREADDEVAPVDAVIGDGGHPEERIVRRPLRPVVERLVKERRAGPERLREGVHHLRQRARLEVGEQDDAAGGPVDVVADGAEGRPPLARLQAGVRAALQDAAHAVRVVEPQQRRLSARAEHAAVDGVLRVALGLGHAPVAVPQVHAAASRALAAGGGEEGELARLDVLRRDDVGDEPVRRLARQGEAGGRLPCGKLQEIATRNILHRRPRRSGRDPCCGPSVWTTPSGPSIIVRMGAFKPWGAE